jgi:RNA polymerase sigma-70 factor (ECF subfamily)
MSRWTGERFTRFVSPHLNRLHRLALHLTGRRADAERLFVDALSAVFDGRIGIDHPSDPASALIRALYSQFVDARARYGGRPLRLVAPAEIEELAAMEVPDGVARLRRALARLTEEQRLAVVLADVEGLPVAEIAELIEIPLDALTTRLRRGRARLRELLAAEGDYVAAAPEDTRGARRDAV